MLNIPERFASLIITLIRRCQRALLCTSKKDGAVFSIGMGSLTVEAAVILPLFLLAAFSLVSVVDICRIQTVKQTQICQQAKRLSAGAYGMTEEPYIDLADVEPCKLAVTLIPGYTVPIALRGRVHGWIGRTEGECVEDREKQGEMMVYVTEHESVYHKSSECTHLDISIQEVEKSDVDDYRNTHGGKYHACEKCCSKNASGETCYISSSGDRYHDSQKCSALTRNVKLVRASEVTHLSVCSRCGGA